MDKPEMILRKKADSVLNRIVLPKKFITKFGREFSMEIYEDRIIIIPIRKGN